MFYSDPNNMDPTVSERWQNFKEDIYLEICRRKLKYLRNRRPLVVPESYTPPSIPNPKSRYPRESEFSNQTLFYYDSDTESQTPPKTNSPKAKFSLKDAVINLKYKFALSTIYSNPQYWYH